MKKLFKTWSLQNIKELLKEKKLFKTWSLQDIKEFFTKKDENVSFSFKDSNSSIDFHTLVKNETCETDDEDENEDENEDDIIYFNPK
jgi:hypothetical protein